jgi:PAS domain S-box-containing protein
VWGNLVEYQTTFELRDIQGTLIPIDLWPVKKVQRGEKVQDYNAWMKRKDTGTSVLVTYTGVRVYDRNKECINMVFTMRDVTVQKHLEEQLHREHELLQTIYDSIPVMLTIYDPSKLTFQVNKFLEQVTGWINEEMGQSDAMEKVYPDPAYRALVSEYVKSLQPGFKDLIMTGKCGEKIESSWANIQLADGRQVGIGLDIRERKRSEEELRLAYSRLRTLFDHRISGIGILFARADGEITEANDFFLQMLGYTREEFQSGLVNWKTLTPPEWDTTDKTALTQLQERGVSETLEKEYLHCNGKRVPVLVVGALMPGTANDILAFVMDITERKIAEKELVERANKLAEANRNLESFSYSVSHDLRNPLHTIKGICEFFHDEYGHIDERCREYLRLIDVAVDKANTLISNILRLSRISQQEIVVQQVDLSEIALMLIKELRQKEPHREVEVSIGDNLIVTGDRMLLTIALSNLLENAWKYTGKTKQPLIEFDSISHCAINDHQSSAFKQFFVRDNGVGFAMKYAYKLFKAFQRLHTERDFPGTGVGLTIVEQVIKKHGGRVWAESEIGKGSTFYFTIPDQWRP